MEQTQIISVVWMAQAVAPPLVAAAILGYIKLIRTSIAKDISSIAKDVKMSTARIEASVGKIETSVTTQGERLATVELSQARREGREEAERRMI